MEQTYNLLLLFVGFLAIYFVVSLLKKGLTTSYTGYTENSDNYAIYREGMETGSDTSTGGNGIAGNGATYLNKLTDINQRLRDELNLSNSAYRKTSEDIILQMDDLINLIQIKTILTTNKETPEKTIIKLSEMSKARVALNDALKFLDKQ